MNGMTAIEALLRRERLIIAAGLILICLLGWLYVIGGAGTGMSTADMKHPLLQTRLFDKSPPCGRTRADDWER